MDEKEARIISIHQSAWAGSSSIMRVKEGQVAKDGPGFFKVTVCSPGLLIEPTSTSDTYYYDPENPRSPGEWVAIVV